MILGIVCIVVITLLAQFLRSGPETTILPNSNENEKVSVVVSGKALSFKEAVKARHFWMVSIAWLLYGFFYQIGLVHIVPYATDLGMSAISASIILAIIGLLGMVGRPTMGFAADRLGNKATAIASLVLLSVAFSGLSATDRLWMLYLFAVIYGFFCGLGILLSPIIVELFGLRALGTILGAVLLANSIGGAIGPIVAGHIFDTTGTYHLAFITCATLGIIGVIIVCQVRKL